MKKALTYTLAATLLMASLTACGNQADDKQANSSDVTIEYSEVNSTKENEPTEEELGLVEGYEEPPVMVQYSMENDLNGDGIISKEEWEAWVAAHPEDTNKDMYLSPEELGIEAPSYPDDEGDGQPDIVEPATPTQPEQKPATPAEKPAEKPTTPTQPTQPEQKPTTPTQPTQPEQKPSTGDSKTEGKLSDLTGDGGTLTPEEWQKMAEEAGLTYDPSTGGMSGPSDWFEP